MHHIRIYSYVDVVSKDGYMLSSTSLIVSDIATCGICAVLHHMQYQLNYNIVQRLHILEAFLFNQGHAGAMKGVQFPQVLPQQIFRCVAKIGGHTWAHSTCSDVPAKIGIETVGQHRCK